MDDRVLVLGDTERGVLVGDPGQQRVGTGVGTGQQRLGEGRDRSRQGLALLAAGLVAAVEQPVQQLGLLGEHGAVETRRDLVQCLADNGQGGANDSGRFKRKHGSPLCGCAGT